ncbi:MAG: hypothetical protein EXR75_14140 [Myxococcales bacterium]|nr:hypothetical protein [Myxococcales bacterium]
MKVLFVASECAPFAKTGGLGDVVGALPKYLVRRGLDVRVVAPLYRGLPWDDFELLEGPLVVPMGFGPAFAGVRMGRLPGTQVKLYLLEHHHYFDRPQPPAAEWRDWIVPGGGPSRREPRTPSQTMAAAALRPHRAKWADLLKRVFEIDVLTCPWCGGERKLIALLTDGAVVRRILEHLGLPTTAPTLAPARAPPELEFAG